MKIDVDGSMISAVIMIYHLSGTGDPLDVDAQGGQKISFQPHRSGRRISVDAGIPLLPDFDVDIDALRCLKVNSCEEYKGEWGISYSKLTKANAQGVPKMIFHHHTISN